MRHWRRTREKRAPGANDDDGARHLHGSIGSRAVRLLHGFHGKLKARDIGFRVQYESS